MKSAIERESLRRVHFTWIVFKKSNKLHCSTNHWKFLFYLFKSFSVCLSRPFFFYLKSWKEKRFFFSIKYWKNSRCVQSIRPRTKLSIWNVCSYVYIRQDTRIHLHLPIYIYMVLIVLLVFVCVRTSEQMAKLINGGSKISLSLSRSFILLFFVPWMFVPIMLLSTQRQSHGLASDRASMCTHTYTQ